VKKLGEKKEVAQNAWDMAFSNKPVEFCGRVYTPDELTAIYLARQEEAREEERPEEYFAEDEADIGEAIDCVVSCLAWLFGLIRRLLMFIVKMLIGVFRKNENKER
jgi:hypothetical protein